MDYARIEKISGVAESVNIEGREMQIKFRNGITVAVDVNAAQGETIEAGDAIEVDFVKRTVILT